MRWCQAPQNVYNAEKINCGFQAQTLSASLPTPLDCCSGPCPPLSFLGCKGRDVQLWLPQPPSLKVFPSLPGNISKYLLHSSLSCLFLSSFPSSLSFLKQWSGLTVLSPTSPSLYCTLNTDFCYPPPSHLPSKSTFARLITYMLSLNLIVFLFPKHNTTWIFFAVHCFY